MAHGASGTPIPMGLTLSSFTSLSISRESPERPAVTFNIGAPSRTLAAIEETREFCIHVLSGDERGTSVAAIFAGENRDPERPVRRLVESGYSVVSAGGGGQRAAWLEGTGVLFVLRCRLLKEPLAGLVRVRDHVVVLGEVLEIVPVQGQPETTKLGLAYADRQYREPGKILKANHN